MLRRTFVKSITSMCGLFSFKNAIFDLYQPRKSSSDWVPIKRIYKVRGHYRIVLWWNPRVMVFALPKHLNLTRNKGWVLTEVLRNGDEISVSQAKSDGSYWKQKNSGAG